MKLLWNTNEFVQIVKKKFSTRAILHGIMLIRQKLPVEVARTRNPQTDVLT